MPYYPKVIEPPPKKNYWTDGLWLILPISAIILILGLPTFIIYQSRERRCLEWHTEKQIVGDYRSDLVWEKTVTLCDKWEK